MDYVVAGLAIGSGLAIVGFLMREAGFSRRFSLPRWLTELGLVLMGTGVVSWCLTFTSLITDQPDSTATTLITAGTIVAFIAGMVLLAQSVGSRRPRQDASLVSHNVRAEKGVAEVPPVSTPSPESGMEGTVPAAESIEADALSDEPTRNRQDWEAIWRETWGSNELPRALGGNQAIAFGDTDPARQTWSAVPSPTDSDAERSDSVPPDAAMVAQDQEDPADVPALPDVEEAPNGAATPATWRPRTD